MSMLLHSPSIVTTLVASLKSIGTACTLAGVGVYLQYFGYISNDGKRTLALISQQVTFPLYLFTKILYCNQDWSENDCPDVTNTLQQVWILLLWPIYVVGTGLLVGYIVAIVTKVPTSQRRSVIAACGFGNSTGLPITLLTVIHSNFPSTSDLGRIDPTLFLSVYLLLYPALQWGIGGWMLAPIDDETLFQQQKLPQTDTINTINETSALIPSKVNNNIATVNSIEKETTNDNMSRTKAHQPQPPRVAISDSIRTNSSGDDRRKLFSNSFRHNVLNNTPVKTFYKSHRRGLSSADESMYISELDLPTLLREQIEKEQQTLVQLSALHLSQRADEADSISEIASNLRINESFESTLQHPQQQQRSTSRQPNISETTAISYGALENGNDNVVLNHSVSRALDQRSNHTIDSIQQKQWHQWIFDTETIFQTIRNVFDRCFQPPVMGSIFGIIAASTPIRGYLVDIVDRRSHAPFQWMFDGLHTVGQTSVPLNMMILGSNLASSYLKSNMSTSSNSIKDGMFSIHANAGIVIGKLIILPFIGIVTVYILKHYILHIDDDIDGSLYLVMMIVFLCPTANNVMIMVELSGSNAKESIARVIAIQYAIAPIVLSIVMTIAIGVADSWS